MRHVEPGIGADPIGQRHHQFGRDTASLRRRVQVRPRGEAARVEAVRVVGVDPVHESQRAETLEPIEEDRVEDLLRAGLLVAGHPHVDIAYVVRRVGPGQPQEDAACAEVELEPVGGRVERFGPIVTAPQPDVAVALPRHDVTPHRHAGGFEQHRRLGPRPGLQATHPPAVVEVQRRAFAPACPLLLADPAPGGPEHVHERPGRAPVRDPAEVDADARGGRPGGRRRRARDRRGLQRQQQRRGDREPAI